MDSLDDKEIGGLLGPRDMDTLGSTCSGSRVTFSTRSTADSASMCSVENSATGRRARVLATAQSRKHCGYSTPPRIHVMTQLRDMTDHISCLAQSREETDQASMADSEFQEGSDTDVDQQGSAGSWRPGFDKAGLEHVDMLSMMRQMDSNMTVQQFLQSMERSGNAGSKGQASARGNSQKGRGKNQASAAPEGSSEETRRRIGGSLPFTDRRKAAAPSDTSIGTNAIMFAQLNNLEHQISVHGRNIQNIEGSRICFDDSDSCDQESQDPYGDTGRRELVDMDDFQYQQPYRQNPYPPPQRPQYPVHQNRGQAAQHPVRPQSDEFSPQQAYPPWSGGGSPTGGWGGPPAGAYPSRHGGGYSGGYPQSANGGYRSGPQARNDLQGPGDMGPCSGTPPRRQQHPQAQGQWQHPAHPQQERQYYPQQPPWQQQQQQQQQQQPSQRHPAHPQQFHQQPAPHWQQQPPQQPAPPQQHQPLHRQQSPSLERQHHSHHMAAPQQMSAAPCAYAPESGYHEGCNPAVLGQSPSWSNEQPCFGNADRSQTPPCKRQPAPGGDNIVAASHCGNTASLDASGSANAAAGSEPVAPGSAAELHDQAQMLLRTFGTLTEQVCFWAGDVDLCAGERCQLGNLVLNCVKPCIHMDQGLAEFYMDLQAELRSLREELELK